jgi:hypothetical protein
MKPGRYITPPSLVIDALFGIHLNALELRPAPTFISADASLKYPPGYVPNITGSKFAKKPEL